MGNFEDFKREKVLIIVEDGVITGILATDDLEVIIMDKDEPEFTNFYNADALDEVVDHETMTVIVDEIINEFHEEVRMRNKDE